MSDSIYNELDMNAQILTLEMIKSDIEKFRRSGRLQEAFTNFDGKVAVTHKVTYEQIGADTAVAVESSFVHTKIKVKNETKYNPKQNPLPFGTEVTVETAEGSATGAVGGGTSDDPLNLLNGDQGETEETATESQDETS